jgi:hypothetical protein
MTVAERKLPGETRSADEVMEDYRQYRSRFNPVLAPLLVPDPENIYRWRATCVGFVGQSTLWEFDFSGRSLPEPR